MKNNNIKTVMKAIFWALFKQITSRNKYQAYLSVSEFYIQIELKSKRGYSIFKIFLIK